MPAVPQRVDDPRFRKTFEQEREGRARSRVTRPGQFGSRARNRQGMRRPAQRIGSKRLPHRESGRPRTAARPVRHRAAHKPLQVGDTLERGAPQRPGQTSFCAVGLEQAAIAAPRRTSGGRPQRRIFSKRERSEPDGPDAAPLAERLGFGSRATPERHGKTRVVDVKQTPHGILPVGDGVDPIEEKRAARGARGGMEPIERINDQRGKRRPRIGEAGVAQVDVGHGLASRVSLHQAVP